MPPHPHDNLHSLFKDLDTYKTRADSMNLGICCSGVACDRPVWGLTGKADVLRSCNTPYVSLGSVRRAMQEHFHFQRSKPSRLFCQYWPIPRQFPPFCLPSNVLHDAKPRMTFPEESMPMLTLAGMPSQHRHVFLTAEVLVTMRRVGESASRLSGSAKRSFGAGACGAFPAGGGAPNRQLGTLQSR